IAKYPIIGIIVRPILSPCASELQELGLNLRPNSGDHFDVWLIFILGWLHSYIFILYFFYSITTDGN
ncbi:hypothetical protein, partial [Endozoicomonas sp. ONNA2]|uniref:hypothetical protein n=1 Tax=Endozoicomonas sp. ONNA2 TaxID=2828741 RepID=UPI00214986C7